MVKSRGMKVCIIGPKKSKSSLRLKLAAESRGYICKRLQLIDIFFEIQNNLFLAKHRKFDLLDYDIYLFGTILPGEINEAFTLAKYLRQDQRIVIDNGVTYGYLNNYEIYQRLSQESIPTINRVITTGIKTARDVLMDFQHPILIKPLDQTKKRCTVSEDWTESYDIVRTEKTKKFEIQELLESKEYFRAFVVGNKVVGVLKRRVLEDDLRLNHACKAQSEVCEVTNELNELAIKSASAIKYEIASVDITYKKENLVVLNIERVKRFSLFNKFFERKFEDLIIDYLESKLSQNH